MEVVLDAVADAFMSVSVLVAALFVLCGVVRVRWGARFEALISRRERTGPLFAVAATLPPGCIGVLAVSRLYVAGSVSYGTVIAALVSTMGDTAWLLLAKDPLFTIGLKLAFAALGITVGWLVDHFGIQPREDSVVVRRTAALAAVGPGSRAVSTADDVPAATAARADPCGASGPDDHAPTHNAEHHHTPPPALSTLFLACLGLGLLVSLPNTLHLVPEELTELPALVLGVLGTVVAVVVVMTSRGHLGCGEEENAVERSLSEVLRNGSREAAFVTVWVSGVFLAWELAAAHLPLDGGVVPLEGVVGVLVAAALGLVPACGVEVLVSALFVSGVLPASALITYLVSQDGNGFIPIATRRPRAAAHGMALTTLLALAVGLVVLAFA